MKKYFFTFLGLFIIYGGFAVPAKAEGIKEGQWTMTMVTKADGAMGAMSADSMKMMDNLPPDVRARLQEQQAKMGLHMNADGLTMTHTVCITQQNPVPEGIKTPEGCQQTHEVNGDTVNFHMTCNNQMQTESTGSMTYSGDSMEGHIKSHSVVAGKPIDSTLDITGQYVGPC